LVISEWPKAMHSEGIRDQVQQLIHGA